MNWKFFIGACFLVFMALLKYGAPVPALAAGIGLAALLNWWKLRQAVGRSHNKS
jgi:hypothetical protein